MQSLRRHPGRNRLHPTHQIALAAQTLAHLTLAHLTLAHLTLATLLRQTLATLSRSRALGAQTIAILLRRQSRATPTGRELACEYRTAGLPVKSSPSEKGRI